MIILCFLFCFFFLGVFVAPLNRFINILIERLFVKCNFCKKIIGSVISDSECVRVTNFQFIRIDPVQLISVCESPREDEVHAHSDFMVMGETETDSSPVEISGLCFRHTGELGERCQHIPNLSSTINAGPGTVSGPRSDILPNENSDFEAFLRIFNRLLDNEPAGSRGHSTDSIKCITKLAYAEYSRIFPSNVNAGVYLPATQDQTEVCISLFV